MYSMWSKAERDRGQFCLAGCPGVLGTDASSPYRLKGLLGWRRSIAPLEGLFSNDKNILVSDRGCIKLTGLNCNITAAVHSCDALPNHWSVQELMWPCSPPYENTFFFFFFLLVFTELLNSKGCLLTVVQKMKWLRRGT